MITLLNVIATIIALVGPLRHLPGTSSVYFSGTYCTLGQKNQVAFINLQILKGAILSLLVVHSFGRVVARHEREALLQHPSAWDPLYYVEKVTNGEVRPGLTNASVASNPWRLRSPVDPFTVPEETLPDNVPGSSQERNVDKGKGKATRQPAENPFEDFELLDPPTVTIEREVERLVDDRGVTYTREEIPPDQQSLSTLSSESVSRYSENSMARSLFYLEGYHR